MRPRYSVSTAPLESRNWSAISATAAALSARAMVLLTWSGVAGSSGPEHDERPGAGARGVTGRTWRLGRTLVHLRGPSARCGAFGSRDEPAGNQRSLVVASVRGWSVSLGQNGP